ncbi:MAG TPA: hypothetical protein VFP06_01870, partial [Acidimicrobiales bacterium]|nr:hypothetical protein [Acidimicrobiales bacterium]
AAPILAIRPGHLLLRDAGMGHHHPGETVSSGLSTRRLSGVADVGTPESLRRRLRGEVLAEAVPL